MRKKSEKKKRSRFPLVFIDESLPSDESKTLIKQEWGIPKVFTPNDLNLRKKKDKEIVEELEKRYPREEKILFTGDKKFKKQIKDPKNFKIIKISSAISQMKKPKKLEYIKKFLNTVSPETIRGEEEFTIASQGVIKKYKSGHTSKRFYKF